ncbi:MAG: tryptophan synthase subunit beta, partial [Halobacteriaceae archaeon]
ENDDELGDLVLVTVSGRGDKDLEAVLEESSSRGLDAAPELNALTGGESK